MLLRKDIAQDLVRSTQDEYWFKLKNLPIVVAQDTSTFLKFSNVSDTHYQKVSPVNKTDSVNAREYALDILDKGKLLADDGTEKEIQAYASDAVIIETLFQDGVNEEGVVGEPYYQKRRDPYKQYKKEGREFVIFPSQEYPAPDGEKYLPHLSKEFYGIAFRKTDADQFLNVIDNKVLAELDKPESALAKARDNIERFEKGTPVIPPNHNDAPAMASEDRPINAGIIVIPLGIVVSAFLIVRKWKKSAGKATPALPYRRLRGLVLDDVTNTTIQGAKLTLETEGRPTIQSSNAGGNFFFSVQCPENTIWLRVDARGYQSWSELMCFSEEAGILETEIRLSRKIQAPQRLEESGNKRLTELKRQRLQLQLSTFQKEYITRTTKLAKLSQELAIETSTNNQFKLEHQIQIEKEKIEDLENKLSRIEHILDSDIDFSEL
ncbi:MAG: hypothetical protein J0L70_17070 [Leptolyngbya sp. UWPOB_LEPTO1]|uniref:hypothetical protein n=1 Tax=Leptolyngbya sp. UWPOB_LEPTO1 TaxID=2815653 RepID=UPI001AC75824|nr:hypothetical protein [Leptolyngbya sp. UWPOB_LEPTO1]MBN8562244.1 hypothetical protein [Leptolyngbya sp. UWPOB_LEPTO1]